MSDHDPGSINRDDATERSDRQPLILAVVGLVTAALLFAAAAIPVLRDGGDDDNPVADSPTEPEDPSTGDDGTVESGPSTTAAVGPIDEGLEPVDSISESTGPTTSVPVADTITSTPPTTSPTMSTVDSTMPTTTVPETDDVPESRAVVRGGQIVLEGAVPDEESARGIVELAAEILGPENVINNYVIDPRADDPNLGNVRVDDTILFEPDTATIAPEFEPLLNQALALMFLRPSVTMTVVGHTDSVGTEAYNQRLSERRAEAVVGWLTDRGIGRSRLTAEGRGETEPIADNETVEGRELNRRIQVFIENLLADS